MLPSSRRLAEELGVSRNTVILSYQHLVGDGFLISRERSGFVVAEQNDRSWTAPQEQTQPRAITDWDDRIRSKASSQRAIKKPSNWQAYKYPFLYGQFDPSIFPIAAWRQCCRQALGVLELCEWGRDTIDEDDPMLVEQLQSRILPRRGIWADKSEIMITLGTQQALYLLSCALFGPDTTVGVEDPGYPDMRNIARMQHSRIVSLPIDGEGLVAGEELARCDYAHVTPSHQCPSTATMPASRRKRLLDQAQAAGTVLIEDDYDSEMVFDGAPQPALKSLDGGDNVIYVSSLSKTLAPGLRLGFIVAPAPLIRELRALRRLMVRHPPLNNQRAVALFLSLGHYEALVRQLTDVYRSRAALLAEALAHYLPQGTFRPATGGACIWFEGPPGFDACRALERAREDRLLFEPGEVFFRDPERGRAHVRLGYSVIPESRIEEGVSVFSQLVREQTLRAPVANRMVASGTSAG